MKKLLIAFFSIFSLFLGGCLKDTPNVDFSNIVPHAEFVYPGGANNNGLGAGMEFFGGGAWTFPPVDINGDPYDTTIFFMVNIAAPNPLSAATNVTIGVDPALITAYNADTNHSVKYEQMPDSCYTLLKTSGSIAAGKYLDTFQLTVFPSKIDPTKNYMAPVTILNAGSVDISQNFGTIWFHSIGNPIAGAYRWDFLRYNNDNGAPPLSTLSFFDEPTLFLPDDPTTIEVPSGYFTQPRYVVSFDNNGGVLSNFTVTFNAEDIAYMNANGVVVFQDPVIITADPINGIYEFQWIAYTGAAYRYIIDKYYK